VQATAKKKSPKTVQKIKPTIEQFTKYQAAYDHFNAKLFGNQLRPCLLVFREGAKKKGLITLGHFAWDRWERDGTLCHEISLNPETLRLPLVETMATLVHEMVHQWQDDHGRKPRSAYHDKQWAAKMVEVGLIPSNTCRPGGKQIGQQMGHYPEENGRFLAAFASMPESIRLPWVTGGNLIPEKAKEEEEKAKAKNKIKYTCAGCELNVWGKPGLNIVCADCDEPFTPEDV
jgi:predicted SprT family Zn-dependent metalloprotease